jgi:hypothetical protein
MLTALRCAFFPFPDDMVRNFTTALVAALVLGSAGIASARPAWEATSERVFAPSIEHYDGWTYPQRGAVLLSAQLALRTTNTA